MESEPGLLPIELELALEKLIDSLASHQARYSLIGGIAVAIRGRVRATDDIDLIVSVPQIQLPGLLDELTKRGFRCDPAELIGEWAQHHFIAFTFGSIRIDWMKPVLPAYEHVLASATEATWRGKALRVATAEGLIVTKVIAARDRDWADIDELLAANSGQLNLESVRQELAGIFPPDDARWNWLDQAIREYYDQPS